MAKRTQPDSEAKALYNRLIHAGHRRLSPEQEPPPDPMAALVSEFRARRADGEKVSIRQFCGEHRISQKQFEARLHAAETPPPETERSHQDTEASLAYYARPEVQQALFLWAQGRRLAAMYSHGVIGSGFRRPEDVMLLAAAKRTHFPTFHASVGRYDGTRLIAFELIAEVDHKGDWKRCFRAVRPLVHSLHDNRIEFLVKFSGNSSAHVLVPCQSGNYAAASEAFYQKIKHAIRHENRLDLTFRKPQHFLRMPYALHERTGLVSLPLTLEEFDHFDPEMARPENVAVRLDRLQEVLSADNSPLFLK